MYSLAGKIEDEYFFSVKDQQLIMDMYQGYNCPDRPPFFDGLYMEFVEVKERRDDPEVFAQADYHVLFLDLTGYLINQKMTAIKRDSALTPMDYVSFIGSAPIKRVW